MSRSDDFWGPCPYPSQHWRLGLWQWTGEGQQECTVVLVAQGKLSEEKILDRPNEDAKARPSFLAVFVTSQARACKYSLYIYIYIEYLGYNALT